MGRLAELVGKRLREVRKRKGLKQEDMEAFGISYKYYQKIERGNANITLETLEKISAAFHMDPVELFSFPMSKYREINELVALVGEIMKKDDTERARKLNLVIKELLS